MKSVPVLRSDITLITVDLDDTLWPCEPVILAAERELQQWLQCHAPRLAAAHDKESMREHRRRLSREYPEIAHDITALRRRSLQELLDAHRYSARLADRAMDLFLQVRNRVQPYPEVAAALRRLGRRYTLVATTNGNADVESTPLRGLFHHAINAAQAGAMKPAPELFLTALEWGRAEPAQALHLGDDPLLDVAAAQAIGMQAVWVDRRQRNWPADQAPPTCRVDNLDQLLSWLEVRTG